ncbi:MAG TPA: metallophosphoesterase, partial [Bacteroidales bacterium]|nr:metallophosphoesterase [Bacteroidales bacterium]
MKKIIHLSDLHVGYRDCGKRFHTIVWNIKKLQQPAKDFIIVITGDLADNANINEHREEAASGIEELQRAGFRVLVVPGNHDYGTGTFGNPVFVSIFKNRFFGTVETNYPRLDIFDDMAFIGLD